MRGGPARRRQPHTAVRPLLFPYEEMTVMTLRTAVQHSQGGSRLGLWFLHVCVDMWPCSVCKVSQDIQLYSPPFLHTCGNSSPV